MSNIEEFVKRKDPTVKFAKAPEAIEYRTSLKILEEQRKEKLENTAVSWLHTPTTTIPDSSGKKGLLLQDSNNSFSRLATSGIGGR